MFPHCSLRFSGLLLILSLSAPLVARTEEPKTVAAQLLVNLPIEMTVKQRSTVVVPGSNKQLELTIDDITRGQVMATLSGAAGPAVVPRMSLVTGRGRRFVWAGEEYRLKVKKLNNALIGEDFAEFVIDKPGPKLTEEAKIEALLAVIAEADGVEFIRNDKSHTGKQASDHLRMKWKAVDKELTALQFIEQIASKSSVSGKAYEAKSDDGAKVPVELLMRARLLELEADEN